MQAALTARPPMTDTFQPSGESHDADLRDEAVGRLINEFFDRRESGEDFTKEEFLAQHAEYAEELRDHLKGLDLISGIGSSSADDPLKNNQTQSVAHDRRRLPNDGDEIHIPEIPGYQIHRPIGRGGMGLVYKATQSSTGRQVALKVLLEGPFAAPQSRKRFEREISLSAQLRHPNIIPIYDSGRTDGRMYYAMEYVRGLPLNEFILRENPGVKQRLQMFLKIGAALRHAHQRGVIHRDLKPTNVLVNADGEPHLLDFGLAKQGTFSDMTTSLTAQIIGTPAYMSPEQAAGDPSGIDVRTDVYSLGVVLFEMLSGQMPYDTKVSIGKLLTNIAKTDPDESVLAKSRIDAELTAILLKALEKNKDDRYQSVDAFVSDVSRYLADEPISVRPATGVYLLRRMFWKHRIAAATAAVAAILLAGAGLTWHRVNAKFAEKQEQIALRDIELKKKQEEQDRLYEDIQEKKDRITAYENTLKNTLQTLNVDSKSAEAIDAFLKLNLEGGPAVPGIVKALSRIGESQSSASSGGPISAPGKDLEAKEFTLSDIASDLLEPAQAPTGKTQDDAMPMIVWAYLEGLKQSARKEAELAATTQPTSQPAGSAGASELAERDAAPDSAAPSDSPNATNKS